MTQEELNGMAKKVLDAAFRVHTVLGAGLLETAYTACPVYELRKAGLDVRTEVPVPIVYDGQKLTDVGYRIDILVENEIVLEIKSVEALASVHFSQIVSYLRLANRRLGFLINFNVESLREGDSSARPPLLKASRKVREERSQVSPRHPWRNLANLAHFAGNVRCLNLNGVSFEWAA